MSSTIKSLLVVAAALAVAGCGQAKKANASGGAVVQVSTFALKTDVVHVELIVSDLSNPANTVLVHQNLVRSSAGVFEAKLTGLPAGIPLVFEASAVDAGAVLYSGSVTTTILQDQLAQVAIRLQEVTPANAYTNAAPVIQSLTASARIVGQGKALLLSVGAVDPDGDPLSYLWSATPGDGSFNGTQGSATATWTAPNVADGTNYTMRVSVTDAKATVVAQLAITVAIAPLGDVGITVSFNDAPVIALSNTILIPIIGGTPLPPPYDVQLEATVTDDGPAAPVTTTWKLSVLLPDGSDNCFGEFLGATALSTRFITMGAAAGLCSFELTATDALGATNTATLVVMVDPGLAAGGIIAPPPRLVSAFITPFDNAALTTVVGAGGVVELYATFFQDIGSVDPTYAVTSSVTGAVLPLGTPLPNPYDPTQPFYMSYQFPAACDASGPVSYTITATASDGVNPAAGLPAQDVTAVFQVVFCP